MSNKREEQDMLKVLKMNQEQCEQALDKARELRAQASSDIAATDEFIKQTDEFIKQLDSTMGRQSRPEFQEPVVAPPPPVQIETPHWEDLVEEANWLHPEEVTWQDLLTPSEYADAMRRLDEINAAFSKKTSIFNKTDLCFLAVATALQVAKTLLFPFFAGKAGYGDGFDPDARKADNDSDIKKEEKESKDQFKEKHKNHGKKHWLKILYQSVPYDTSVGSSDAEINLHGRYHRLYTLGHDPVWGWIFGPANILTDCITFNTFQTNRVSRINPVTGKKQLRITKEIVPMPKMFVEAYQCAREDRLNLPAAVVAHGIHLKSDEYTKLGLPVPILSAINEEFASKLYSENYDALCFSRDLKIIGASFAISKFIDVIIALVHGLFRKEEEPKDLYEVRTRKILLVSNSIAGTSTVIQALVTQNVTKLDIGGLLELVSRLFTDIRFITRIKQEFVEQQLDQDFQGVLDELDEISRTLRGESQ
jgi:hypothetical protein